MRLAALLLALALGFVSACGTSTLSDLAGGSVNDTEWSLQGVSPDGSHLLVSTLFGGVASDCTRFEGWEVVESGESVEITARLWERRAPAGCTDEGVVESLQVDLEQPLGDRDLVGCGADNCLSVGDDGGMAAVGQIVVGTETIAVGDQLGIVGYDATGEPVAAVSGSTSGRFSAVDGDVAVRNDRDGNAVAVELSAGTELWRTRGWLAATSGDVAYVCRGQDSDGLTAVDSMTGADLWTTDLPCEPLVDHGDLLHVIAYDENVDGGQRLVVIDATTGAAIMDEPLDDGIDDRVGGLDGAIAAGANTVVAGPQADLIVLGPDGTELAREPTSLGVPIGNADDVPILVQQDRVRAFDVAELSELWELRTDGFTTVAVDAGSAWLLDRPAGTISRLDPETGEPLWSTSIGFTTAFDASARDGVAYVVTTQALIAIDNDDGSILWSQHRPYVAAE